MWTRPFFDIINYKLLLSVIRYKIYDKLLFEINNVYKKIYQFAYSHTMMPIRIMQSIIGKLQRLEY